MALAFLLTVSVLIEYVTSQCQFSEGPYTASWQYDASTQGVQFSIQYQSPTPSDYWTGIGFGKQMKGGDFVTITNTQGGIKAQDRFGTGHTEPQKDAKDDVENFNGNVANGQLLATFGRAVKTGDSQDVPLIDPATGCQCFLFPVSGGSAADQGGDVSIDAHGKVPTKATVCNITQCSAPGSTGGRVLLDGCSGKPATGGPARGGGPANAGGIGAVPEDPEAAGAGQPPKAGRGGNPSNPADPSSANAGGVIPGAGPGKGREPALGGDPSGIGNPAGGSSANGFGTANAGGEDPNAGGASNGGDGFGAPAPRQSTPRPGPGGATSTRAQFGIPTTSNPAAGGRNINNPGFGGGASGNKPGSTGSETGIPDDGSNGGEPAGGDSGIEGGANPAGAGSNPSGAGPNPAGASSGAIGAGVNVAGGSANGRGSGGTGSSAGGITTTDNSGAGPRPGGPQPGSGSGFGNGQSQQGPGPANGGGASSVNLASIVCQPQDNGECQPYIDRYWTQIFNTVSPPTSHPNRKPACNNLIVHQQGQVRRECCNYLKIKCGEFLTPNDPGTN